jgi:hypothetical protein
MLRWSKLVGVRICCALVIACLPWLQAVEDTQM